jgi:hypothetical protein
MDRTAWVVLAEANQRDATEIQDEKKATRERSLLLVR